MVLATARSPSPSQTSPQGTGPQAARSDSVAALIGQAKGRSAVRLRAVRQPGPWSRRAGFAAALAAVIAVVGLPAPTSAHSFRVPVFTPVTSVEVHNSAGPVSIRPGPSTYVDYVPTYRFEPPTVTVTERNGHLEVHAECPGDPWWSVNECGVYLYISVPASASVDATAHVYGVTTSAMRGGQRVRTTSGPISIRDAGAGSIDAFATTGGVTVRNSRVEEVIARATRGPISLEDVRAAVIATKTSSGSISVDNAVQPDRVTAWTTSGDVDVRVPAGRYALGLKTRGERPEVEGVIDDQSAGRRIEVSTTSGRIFVNSR